jgi:hypothetical protein
MDKLKMAWIPFEGEIDDKLYKGGSAFCITELLVDHPNPGLISTEIHVLKCTQRRAAVKQLKEERVRSFEYVLPCMFPVLF